MAGLTAATSGSGRRPAGGVTVGDLYEQGAQAWAGGAELVYAPLAEALVATSPIVLAGRRVLDAGAGTGAGSRALASVGARPVAVDLAWTMLAHGRRLRPPAAVADLYHLPFRARSLGAALCPFVLNHVDQPSLVLARLAGCVQPGGAILASTFSEQDRPLVKDVVDEVAAAHGCRPPEAYRWLRTAAAPLAGSAEAMAGVAEAAGLSDVVVVEVAVDTGISRPDDLVAYRLGMPHLSRFLDTLAPDHRAEVVAEAVAAVERAHDGSSLAPRVVFLSARPA